MRASGVEVPGLSSYGSRAVEPRLYCDAWAELRWAVWDLPRSGIEPVFPVWAGGFFTTELAGKPCSCSQSGTRMQSRLTQRIWFYFSLISFSLLLPHPLFFLFHSFLKLGMFPSLVFCIFVSFFFLFPNIIAWSCSYLPSMSFKRKNRYFFLFLVLLCCSCYVSLSFCPFYWFPGDIPIL